MPDREKIMSWLEGLAETNWRDFHSDSEVQNIAKSALELLKADRETIDELISADKALKLLKEQEAIEPKKEHSGSGITWWNVCGNCKTAINPNDKYCHECGHAVKWE
jgi:rRNA maturation endonuclease Nob1